MREIYHTPVDTLDVESLPDTDNCELRVAPVQHIDGRDILKTMLGTSTKAAAFVLGTRLFGILVPFLTICRLAGRELEPSLGPLLHTRRTAMASLVTNIALVIATLSFLGMLTEDGIGAQFERLTPVVQGIFVILGLAAAGLAWQGDEDPFVVIGLALSGFLLLVYLRVLNGSASGMIPFVIFAGSGMIVSVLVADGIVTTLLGIALCQPRLSEETRQEWEESFGDTQSRLAWYADSLLVLVVGVSVGLILVLLAQRHTGPVSLLGARNVLIATLAMTSLLFVLAVVRRSSISKMLSSVTEAFLLFWSYDGHPSAAGIHHPDGIWQDIRVRQFSVLLAMLLLSAGILPMAAYFPVTLSSPEPWKDIVAFSGETLLNFLLSGTETGEHFDTWRDARRRDLSGYLNSSPEAWVWITLEGISQGKVWFLWTAILSIVFSVGVPLLIVGSTIGTIACPIVTAICEEVLDDDNAEFITNWDGLIDQIQNSEDQIERDSLLVGVHARCRYPVLAHRSMLREHGHILGDTGSGKTAIGIAPMVTQLIRMAGRDAKTEDQQQSSVVILDLKGDPAMFQGARIEAEDAGLPFRWFTNQTGVASFGFNPFLQSHVSSLTPTQWAQIISQSLNLQYGEAYGASFFSAENEHVLKTLLESFEVSSFRELSQIVTDGKLDLLGKKLRFTKKKLEDAQALFTALSSMAPIQALNVIPESDVDHEVITNQIDLPSVLDSPQVIYFYLKAATEAETVRRIGKLAMHCLLSASANRVTSTHGRHQTYLFIDEFQQIVSNDVEIVLRQARSMNIATILAHQTISDLKMNDVDLTPTVQGNTRFKQFFAASDLNQQQTLIEASGETIDHVHSWNHSITMPTYKKEASESFGESITETVQPRLTKNDIIAMTDDPTSSVLQLPRGEGYARFGGYPFPVQGMYHITEEEYVQRINEPWPSEEDWPGTFTSRLKKRQRPATGTQQSTGKPPEQPDPPPAQASPDSAADETDAFDFDDVLDQLDQSARQRRWKGRPQQPGTG